MDDELRQAVEELDAAIQDSINDLGNAMRAWGRIAAEQAKLFFDLLERLKESGIEFPAAVEFEKKANRRWVHIYRNTKKKRIRKKYEKKIIQHWRDSL